MPYRASELFYVETNATIDERVDIWVSFNSQATGSAKTVLIPHQQLPKGLKWSKQECSD